VHAPQLGAWLDADLLNKHRARLAVGIERLRLAAAAIQRDHALGAELLAQRVLVDQRIELADDVGVTAGFEVRVDCLLGGAQPELLQPPNLGGGERLVGQVGERLAAPQCERVTAARLVDQAFEADRVDVAVRQAQLVAATVGDDLGAVALEDAAQVRHVELHHLRRARRRVLAPQAFGESVDRDRLPDPERQHRQDGALLGRPERNRPAIEVGLDGP
jgi:hypothetical protein